MHFFADLQSIILKLLKPSYKTQQPLQLRSIFSSSLRAVEPNIAISGLNVTILPTDQQNKVT